MTVAATVRDAGSMTVRAFTPWCHRDRIPARPAGRATACGSPIGVGIDVGGLPLSQNALYETCLLAPPERRPTLRPRADTCVTLRIRRRGRTFVRVASALGPGRFCRDGPVVNEETPAATRTVTAVLDRLCVVRWVVRCHAFRTRTPRCPHSA